MSADGGPEDAAARDTGSDADTGSEAESAVRGAASANGGSAVRRARAGKGEPVVREAGSVNGEAGSREAGAVNGVAGSGKAGAVNGVAGVREVEGAESEPGALDAVSAPDAEGKPRRTTRRFPLFTRDTARPEGGGRAAGGDAPAPARQWPILAVLSAVGLGLLLTALDVFRLGTILIGAALLAGAVMRWMLPDVGMLAVRSRFTDMVTYGVLGVAIVLLSLMAQPNPWLVIPFLDDTLHFTVR
ncbi:Protein of unknown function DUF3017 [Actinobacteria bacterium OK006]|nr:Protein of unknown function DUF3017 [Actinobacteria bacterium OK006]